MSDLNVEDAAVMSKEVLDLLNKWKKRGYCPAQCAYAMLMKFTAIADEVIDEDDLMGFLGGRKDSWIADVRLNNGETKVC